MFKERVLHMSGKFRTSLNQTGANGFLTFDFGWYVVVHVAIGVCVGAYTGNRNVT